MKKDRKKYSKAIIPIFIALILVSIGVSSCNDTDYTYVPDEIVDHIITGVSPNIGDIGYEVVVSGKNFSLIPSNNKVKFNGIVANVTKGTDSTLVVTVPEGATTGDLTVSHGDLTVSGGTFTVVSIPVIESFSPSVGQEGQEVVITGSKFSTTLEDNIVTFNGLAATLTAATATELTVIVPAGASSGVIEIVVNGQSVTSSEDFVIAVSFSVAINSGNDDVEEVAVSSGEAVGTMDLTSSDLELGELSSRQGLMNVGLRFNNVQVPQGATINNAYVQFKTDDTGSNAVEITIYGEDVANAAAYTTDLNNLSSRTLTTANVVWSISPWVTDGDRGEAQKTADISSIVQEIVNRADWIPGNSINIILKPTGATLSVTSSSGGREAEDYSSSVSDDGAELNIVYN